jgi:hypothetical protein
MAQLSNTVVTGSLSVTGCIYGNVTNATNATNAVNSTCFGGCTYAQAKNDIRNYTPSNATNAVNSTCFGGCTYAQAKNDIRNYTPSNATNAVNATNATNAVNSTCFGGCTYAQAKADIRNYTPSNATCASCISRNIPQDQDASLIYATIGANDYFRLRSRGGANAGFVALETADDATEPISVAQYSGAFATEKRRAYLLDNSGNTSFPGSVTATGGFIGNLTGNITGSAGTAGCSACTCISKRNAWSDAYDFEVSLTNGTSTTYTSWYVSSSCRLRYCNTTGVLRITNNGGSTISGTMCAACMVATSALILPTTSSGINGAIWIS